MSDRRTDPRCMPHVLSGLGILALGIAVAAVAQAVTWASRPEIPSAQIGTEASWSGVLLAAGPSDTSAREMDELRDRRAPSHPTPQGPIQEDPIVIRGTEGGDDIRVRRVTDGRYRVSINGQTYDFTREEMDRLRIQGGSGNDNITVASDVGVGLRIEGGNGDDQITGGGGRDSLDGGPGNDSLRGGDGNDQLVGGSGDDEMSGGRGNDDLAGGAGRDHLTGGRGRDRFFHQPDDRLTDEHSEDTATRVDVSAPLSAGSAGPRPGR